MDYFEKNIERLKLIDAEYAEEICNATDPEWCDTRNNSFFIKRGGRIHKGEQKEWIKAEKEILKKRKLLSEDMSVFVGMGFGEVIKNACTIKEDRHYLIVIEPVAYFIKIAFQRYDFTKYMKKQTLLIIKPIKEKIAGLFNAFDANVVIQHIFLLTNSYTLHRPEDYSEISLYVADIVNQMQCNIGTVMGAGGIIAENDIKNLPYIIRHRGVNEIISAYQDKPAVIVSTGPSLQKNIHILKENKNKVIIIAVAQALRCLLAYDIRPDFICTVDYGEVNAEHFEGLMDCGIPLVALNRSYAGIIKRWKGPKFITTSHCPGYPDTITDLIQKKGTLVQGGSVSHLCLGLAMGLGCNPIALTGQDLAYEGDLSHTKLADANGKIKQKDGVITWEVTDS